MGRLIPAGTGRVMSGLRRVASHRDDLILEERQRTQSLSSTQQITDLSGANEPAE